MAPPGPMISVLLASLDQRGRLRIMDNHELGVQRKPREVTFVAREKNFKILRVGMIWSAMKRVVERFRHSVEVIASRHHVPAHSPANGKSHWFAVASEAARRGNGSRKRHGSDARCRCEILPLSAP